MKLSNQLQSAKPARRRRGLTLVEMMVALGIGSMTLAAAGVFFLYCFRSLGAITNYMDMDIASRNTLDQMTRDIRQMSAVTSFAANEVMFSGLNGATLKYSLSPDTHKLTSEQPVGSAPRELLNSCDSLVFQMFQQNPQSGTNNFTPTTDYTMCKMISVNWKCSRVLRGNQMNTESVQATQIVLRNKH